MENAIGAKKTLSTPVGKVAVFATSNGVAKVEFLEDQSPSIDFSSDQQAEAHCQKAVKWLEDYFHGDKKLFDGPYDISGTNFQQAVWSEISKIEFGKTETYGLIANLVNKPQASRAVGAAVGSNPVPLLIPCHRVMGVASKITGYSGGQGIPTKKQLLTHELIEFKD